MIHFRVIWHWCVFLIRQIILSSLHEDGTQSGVLSPLSMRWLYRHPKIIHNITKYMKHILFLNWGKPLASLPSTLPNHIAQIWPTPITPKKGDMCSHKSSFLHNVANAILIPWVRRAYESLCLRPKVIPHHDAIPKLMAPTHCSHFGDTQLCVATCRLVGYYPLLFCCCNEVEGYDAWNERPTVNKDFSSQAPIVARRLIFVAHEKGSHEMLAALHIWEPWPIPTQIPLD
jgi:hypothetical protein